VADARSYRPGSGQPTTSEGAPSAAVDPAFLNPATYDEYLAAARAGVLAPGAPAGSAAALEALAAANPGLSPDAAVAALATGAPPTDPSVQQIAAMTTEQRAAAIAAGIQAAARDRKTEQNEGVQGLLRATSRTVFNAIEAPFQMGMNAAAYAAGKANGTQPEGVGIGDVFTNTDLGSQVYGIQDGGQPGGYGDQGDGWFTDPNSPAAKMKEGLDNDIAGGTGASLGQRLTNSLQLEKGSAPYSILSGTVDAASRVFDPSMYVGAGEAKAALKAVQGVDAAKGAQAVRVGSAAAAADDALAAARAEAGKAYDAAAAADVAGKRVTTIEDELKLAQQQQLENIVVKLPEARAAAAADQARVDALVADNMALLAERPVEEWRSHALEVEAALKATEHEARTTMTAAVEGAEAARTLRDTMLGEGHILPVPEPQVPAGVTVKTTTATDAELGSNLHTVAFYKDDQPAAQIMWDTETGEIAMIEVNPELRRQGFADSIMDYATDYSASKGMTRPEHSNLLTEDGKAWVAAYEQKRALRGIDEDSITEEAQRRLATEREAYDSQHAEADGEILSWLSLPQRNVYEKHGLIPLSVIKRQLEQASGGGLAPAEHVFALTRHGITDQAEAHARGGSSWLIGEYERASQLLPGKEKGVRYVRIPWKQTKDDTASALEKHADDARGEAIAAADEAPKGPVVSVIDGDDAGATEKALGALYEVLPRLEEAAGVPIPGSVFDGVGTPKEAVLRLGNALETAGVEQLRIDGLMMRLNDDLLEHGVVIDGVQGLAPAGRGKGVQQAHFEAESHADTLAYASGLYGEETAALQSELAAAQAAYKKLTDERPINAAGRRADLSATRVEGLEAQAVKRQLARIASLQRRLKEATDQVGVRVADRDESLAVVRLITEEASRRAGVGAPLPPAADANAHLQFLQDIAGLRKTADGTDVADLDKGIAFLTGTDAEPLYRAITALDNPATLHTLTRGKLPVQMVNELAAAKTVDDARAVFVRYAGRGMLDETTGKLRGLRIVARAAMNGQDPEKMLTAYGKAFGVFAKGTEWGTAAARRNVPWASARHIEDHEGMVNLVSDTINYMERLWRPTRNAEGREWHNEWVNRMLAAQTSEARRTVWYQMLDGTALRAAKAQGLSDELAEQFVGSLKASMARQRNLTSYTAEARAANGGTPLTLNGQPLPKNVAMLEAEMSTRVMTPDWREMRRALKSAQSLERAANGTPEARRAVMEASDAVFDKFWRTSVLAFRGGYVIRNMADIQARMYLTQHPSVFTSPHGLAALALSHRLDPNSAIGRLINKAERADHDVDGRPFEKLDGEDALMAEGWDGFNRVAARDTSLLDPGSPGRAMRLGEVPVGTDHPLFFRGWANELGKMWASPMASDVLKVLTGQRLKALDDHVKATGILDREAALVDYLWSGPGKARLDRLRDLSPTLSERIVNQDDLRAYLFGGEAVSLASRWRRTTLDLDPTIVEHVIGRKVADDLPDGQGVKAATSFLEKRDETARLLRSVSKDSIGDPAFPVQQVNAPVWADRSAGNAFAQRVEGATDAFFHMSSVIEKDLGYLPEFRYAKWDRTAQLVRALSPEDAQKVLATAEETLGGGFYGSWAKRTLNEVRRAAKAADGDGAFTIDDLKNVTDEYGVRQVRDLFYDAQKRNAFGHALRLASPFAQAWANSLRTWGRLAVKKPKQVYKAGLVYRAGQGEGTAWLTDDPSNPDDALFYTDPTTGQQMVGIPVVGSVLAAIGSLASMAHGGAPIDPGATGAASPVSSFNLLFQNGMLPGVGPAISIPATMLDGSDTYQAAVPDWMKRVLVPYTNVDPDRDPGVLEAMVPGWFGTVLAGAGVPGFQERVTKYVKPSMAALFSKHPERYLNDQGFMDSDSQARLLRDANALAHGLTFGKGLLQNMSAGSLQPQVYVQDRNGNNLSQPTLTREFNDLAVATGSREEAMAELVDKYGVEPLLTMLPNREFGYQPTDQAYHFVKDNPGVADEHGSVLSLFLPGGGYSAYMDRWARKRGSNPALDPGEIVDYSNGLLFEAQMGQLERKLVRGEITQDQYDVSEKQLRKDYSDVPQSQRTLNGRNVAVSEIRSALETPELSKTEAGHAADVYLRLRDQAVAAAGGGALGGEGDAPLRAWLREQGEELALQYPEFLVMWTRVFRGEVKD
jgi:GNAT superfamily N-acetyltransferase